jgi:hypothetical protein
MIRRWLHRLSAWVFSHTFPSHESAVVDEVRDAFYEAGLPIDQFGLDFDIGRYGKMNEVYYLAAKKLGKDPQWSTVQDVVDGLND